jgi:hypothetical protein
MDPIIQGTIAGVDMVRGKIASFLEIEILFSVLLPIE